MSEEEGPTLLEQMMKEASLAKESATSREKVEEKSFGSGFRKGFFGDSSGRAEGKDNGGPKRATKSSTVAAAEKAPIAASSDIPTIRPQVDQNNVLPEVQEAMNANTPPALKALQSGEWMTPDLMQKIASSPRLMAGNSVRMQDPKCTKVLEELGRDPKVAMQKYKNDPTITCFLTEFTALLGKHFEELVAEQQQEAKDATTSAAAAPPLEGPLMEEALKKHATSAAANGGGKIKEISKKNTSSSSAEEEPDQELVNKILADPELRALLSDPQMQSILQQCNDRRQLQYHMNHPQTAAKIRKLAAAGLIRIER